MAYRGRFAPSPSGPLHMGSLVAAVGSYLQARVQQGQWLVRIDDIDPPREVAGAADTILAQLDGHGLHWDGEVSYQSEHSDAYEQALMQLANEGLLYACDCTRAQIKARGRYYDGYCRQRERRGPQCALRLVNQHGIQHVHDGLQGDIEIDPAAAREDFILKRRDGFYAYHLACVVDDARQGITEVVRGADLLVPTVCQLSLYKALALKPPEFVHLPVISQRKGHKLSKQNHAKGIDVQTASYNLFQALQWLGLRPDTELSQLPPREILDWARSVWRLQALTATREIILDE